MNLRITFEECFSKIARRRRRIRTLHPREYVLWELPWNPEMLDIHTEEQRGQVVAVTATVREYAAEPTVE